MAHDGHLLVILHLVPTPKNLARRAAIFWRAPDGQWKATGEAKGNVTALKSHVEAFGKKVEELEARVEKATSAVEYFSVLRELGPFQRTATHLHKALQEARDASTDPDIITLRDQAGDYERSAELLYNDAKHGLEFTIARRSEEQAVRGHAIERSSHRLNRLAAVFLPVSALGGAFSMKFASGLEERHAPWIFWGVFASAFLLGFIIRSVVKAEESEAP
jgi:Mg2+ and Co2+ transporter CorA